jgi:hypothetical protein
MSHLKDFLTPETYLEYKEMIYSEMKIILQNKKEYLNFNGIHISEKRRKVSEICDFLYLENDEENSELMEKLLIILRVKENIFSI